jgi:acetoacetyl-CoA synthetase
MTDAVSQPGEILWSPPAGSGESTNMGRYLAWLNERRGLAFAGYEDLWAWSVNDLAGFWGTVADHLGVMFHDPPAEVLTSAAMPGAVWFAGATVNFAEHVLAGPADAVVLVARSESRERIEMTRGDLRNQVAAVRAALEEAGVVAGDRVAAYLPNIPEALVTLLAAASLGAIFTSESGTASVLGKIGQVTPRVLVSVDGYVYGGAAYDRVEAVQAIRAAVPSIQVTVAVPYLEPGRNRIPASLNWNDIVARSAPLEITAVPFDHPLYIVYSSGTTGTPKAIIHSHGGILLEHLKLFVLHDDLRPEDRYFWYSSTNWMAWNYGVSSLLSGGSLLIYDGHPMRPTLAAYWEMVADEGVTYLGTSPGHLGANRKAGVVPRQVADLSRLRTVNSGGAPLPVESWRWVYEAIGSDVYLSSGSGGTDVASSFVSGCRLLPVRAGEIACRLLGVDAKAYDASGSPVIGETGELVICSPMPSMPVGFWGDHDNRRMTDSYFTRFPGVWWHGDWVRFTEYGTCVISGRSDATLNRGGVRLGTGEFYEVVDGIDEIEDSLVVHLDDKGGGELVLFVALRAGDSLTDDLRDQISSVLCEQLSPRHVPDVIQQVEEIPRTLSGKRQEIPVKRVLLDPEASTVGSPLDGTAALRQFRQIGLARAARLRSLHAVGTPTGLVPEVD